MSNDIQQAMRRPLSDKGQICIPYEFRQGVDAYTVVEESTDNQGAPVLTLHPITEDSTQD